MHGLLYFPKDHSFSIPKEYVLLIQSFHIRIIALKKKDEELLIKIFHFNEHFRRLIKKNYTYKKINHVEEIIFKFINMTNKNRRDSFFFRKI